MDEKLQKLKESCFRREIPSINRLRIALEGSYSADEVKFLEPYLNKAPENVQILILKILCLNGNPVKKYTQLFKKPSSMLSAEIIRLAEKQDDVITILEFSKETRKNAHLAILALKRMGKTNYLLSFVLSRDKELSKLASEQQ